MAAVDYERRSPGAIRAFVRNRYFYGKLLDVHHLDLEQSYLNGKRWLLNRLVTGPGVVCGLDVRASADWKSIQVMPGIALDYAGREIVVPRASEFQPLPIPTPGQNGPKPAGNCDDEYVHVVICYRQCEADPEPIAIDECGDTTECAPSTIQERYRIEIRQGRAPKIHMEPAIPDFIYNGRLNYCALVNHITKGCPELPRDLCIPLANVRLPIEGSQTEIDICVRPIVYTNQMLFDLIVGLAGETMARRRASE